MVVLNQQPAPRRARRDDLIAFAHRIARAGTRPRTAAATRRLRIELLGDPDRGVDGVSIPARDEGRRGAQPPRWLRHSSPRVPDSTGIGGHPRPSPRDWPTVTALRNTC
jgi:hypothetical protein